MRHLLIGATSCLEEKINLELCIEISQDNTINLVTAIQSLTYTILCACTLGTTLSSEKLVLMWSVVKTLF